MDFSTFNPTLITQDPFEWLLKLNAEDWANIPEPLRNGIHCIKQCIIINKSLIQDCNHNIDLNLSGSLKRFEQIETATNLMKNTIFTNDETLKNRIQEVFDCLTDEIEAFKKTLNKDLDFKQRSTDKKISLIEENAFTTKRILQVLPTMQDIEEKIKASAQETKERVKIEVKDFIIVPEINKIAIDINNVSGQTENFYSKLDEKIEKIKNYNKETDNYYSEKFRKIQQETEANNEKLVKDNRLFEISLNLLKTEILKTESVFNEKIKNLQVQLDTEQNKNKDLNLTIAGINSKIEIMNEVLLESISNAKNEKISNQSKENKILSNNSSTNFEKNDVDNHQEKKIIENNSESEKNSKIEKNFSKESKIIPETQVLNKNSVKTEDFMKINSESPSIRKNSN